MKRNFGLDIMRCVSIWLVLLQHLGIGIPNMAPLKIGSVGVEIFFVLSGFLIGGILFKEIEKGKSLFQTLGSFWIRRWFRILPLYYLALSVKFIFIDHSIGANILYYVFFLQNNFYGIQYLNVSWSLVIEEWFYLFAPIFLFVSVRFLKSDSKIIASLVLFIVLVFAFRFIYVLSNNPPYVGINGNFPFRFDSLFMGVVVTFINYRIPGLYLKLSRPIVFIVGALFFVFYLFLFRSFVFPVYQIDSILFFRVAGFLILPLTIAIMVPFMTTFSFKETFSPPLKFAYHFITLTSIITYAIYLCHPFVNELLSKLPLNKSSVLFYSLSLVFTYIVAWIVYTFFEKPILKLRDNFSK